MEFFLHPYYEVWQDFIARFYKKPENKKHVLFIPCTYTKPYSKSRLHREIMKRVPDSVHLVVISSPGVVPYEFIKEYPFANYDWEEWKETEEIKKLYIEVTRERIKRYLSRHKYEKYFCFFKYTSESYIALLQACSELGIRIRQCLKRETREEIKDRKNPLLSEKALKDLEEVMVSELEEDFQDDREVLDD